MALRIALLQPPNNVGPKKSTIASSNFLMISSTFVFLLPLETLEGQLFLIIGNILLGNVNEGRLSVSERFHCNSFPFLPFVDGIAYIINLLYM